MAKEKISIENIDLTNYFLIVDTNILMEQVCNHYVQNTVAPALKAYNEHAKEPYKMYIPGTVVQELENLMAQAKDFETQIKAQDGLKTLRLLYSENLYAPLKADYYASIGSFNDVAMISMAIELIRNINVAILTNDRALARDLMNLNLFDSIKHKRDLKVLYIDTKERRLKEWIYSLKDNKIYRHYEFQKELNELAEKLSENSITTPQQVQQKVEQHARLIFPKLSHLFNTYKKDNK